MNKQMKLRETWKNAIHSLEPRNEEGKLYVFTKTLWIETKKYILK